MLTLPVAHICVLCPLQGGKKEKKQLRPKRKEQEKNEKQHQITLQRLPNPAG